MSFYIISRILFATFLIFKLCVNPSSLETSINKIVYCFRLVIYLVHPVEGAKKNGNWKTTDSLPTFLQGGGS